MEMGGGELEDDLFYADLSKQISLLIMDDDDDDDDEDQPLANRSSVSLQGFSHATIPPPLAQAQHMLLHEQRCRREQSKGTGVFIPQSNIPRRKQRQSRFNNNNNHNPKNHNNNNSNNYYYNYSYYSKTNNKQQQHVVAHDNNSNKTQQHHKMVVTSNASFNSKFGATA